MTEYKEFFIILKLLLNTFLPLPILEIDKYVIVAYAASIIFPSLVLIYINYKKRHYFHKYLCRKYIPSNKLVFIVQITDAVITICLYVLIYYTGVSIKWFFVVLILHVCFTLIIFIALYAQKERNKTVIAYTRHKYKLGIMARDVGGANGLGKGQPVEIVQEIPGGYIVKDSSKNDFQVTLEDIEAILDIV